MLAKITQAVVEKAEPKAKRDFIWDAGDGSTKGFGLKIMPGGHKAFVFDYRLGGGRRGSKQRYTIGTASAALTATRARIIAEQLKRDVAAGIDPVAREREKVEQARRAKAAALLAQAGHVELVVADYLKMRAEGDKPPRSLERIKDYLQRYLVGTDENPGPWRGRHIGDIRPTDVRDVLRGLKANGHSASIRHLLGVLRPLFSYAISEEFRHDNPTSDIKPSNFGTAQGNRKRYLDPMELKAVWLAADRMPYPFGPFFKMLILTGQRRNEVAGMARSELQKRVGPAWTIPAERAKNGAEHVVHLSEQAVAVLASPSVSAGSNQDLVFTTTGDTRVSGFSNAKKDLDKLSGVDGVENGRGAWVIHDLRRTLVTFLAGVIKVPPHIADKILSHKSGAIKGVAAIYQQADFAEECAAALEAWGLYVKTLIDTEGDAADVVAADAAREHYQQAMMMRKKQSHLRLVAS